VLQEVVRGDKLKMGSYNWWRRIATDADEADHKQVIRTQGPV